MANYNKGSNGDVPGQVTFPDDASSGYFTSEDGKIYPKERKTTVQDFVGSEGSMGFERNQGVIRDSNEIGNGTILDMGQSKLQKLKATSAGSRSI